MFDNHERKEIRLSSGFVDTMSTRSYNLVMGLCVLYGLLANVVVIFLCADFAYNMNPIALLIGYIVCVIAGTVMSVKSTNPAISFLGYNLICIPIGLVLSISIPSVDPFIVIRAAIATGCITGIMIMLSQIFPRFFSKLGVTLFVSLLAVIIVELVFIIAGWPGAWIDYVVVGIFSLYIGYDFNRAQVYPKTLDNAIDCAIDIYLDVINIFIRLVAILQRNR